MDQIERQILDFFANDEIEEYFGNAPPVDASNQLLQTCNDLTKTTSELAELVTKVYGGRNEVRNLPSMAQAYEDMEDYEFFKNFKVSHKTYDLLLNKILVKEKKRLSRGAVPVKKNINLMIVLKYLGHKCPYREVAEEFRLSESCTHKKIEDMVEELAALAPKYIKWPKEDEIAYTIDEFRKLSGFPNVIGAANCCYIRSRVPYKSQKEYTNRYNVQSTNLFAICNTEGFFTYIYAGSPGSFSDEQVFTSSEIGVKLETTPTSILYDNKNHLVGDSAFALKPYIMVPYKHQQLSYQQSNYNMGLDSTHRVITNALRSIKSRFQRLRYLDVDVHRISKIVTAACVLHNISLQQEEDRVLSARFLAENLDVTDDSQQETEFSFEDQHSAGREKQDYITYHVY